MSEFAKEILHINIEEEMKKPYLDYAMSVIVGRACRTSATDLNQYIDAFSLQ